MSKEMSNKILESPFKTKDSKKSK